MNLVLALYIGAVLLNIGSEIVCEMRYKKLKKDLGYISVRESELSRLFSDMPIITTIVLGFSYLFPLSFVSSIKKNINFEYESLDALKEELDNGVIKLKDDDDLHPVELVHKIKGARKSLVASYLDYLEELARQHKLEQDGSVNNVFEADKSDYEEKKEELKKLQLQFDSTMRHKYESKD